LPALTAASNRAMPPDEGAVDCRPVREEIEEARLRSDGNARQATVPFAKHNP
jgi:hypothetical protein